MMYKTIQAFGNYSGQNHSSDTFNHFPIVVKGHVLSVKRCTAAEFKNNLQYSTKEHPLNKIF